MGSGNGVLIPLTRDATSENFTAISLTDGRGEARNLRHGVDICLTISGARVLTMSTPWRASYLPDVRDELIAEQNSLEARTGLDPALTRALEEHVMRNGPEVTERERRIVAGLQQGRDFQTKIQLGELYWVTGPMTSLAQEASVTMPPFVVDHEMPCPSGLIAYADGLPPLPHPGGQDGTTRVRLMTWVRTGDRVAVQTYADGTDAPVDARRRWQSVGIGALRWYTVATTDLTVGQEVDEEHLTPTAEPDPGAEHGAGREGLDVEEHLVASAQHWFRPPGLVEEELGSGVDRGDDAGEVVAVAVVLTGVGLELGAGEGRAGGGDAGDVAGLAQVRDDLADIEGTVDDRPSPGGAEHPDLRDQVAQLLESVPGQRFVTGLGQ